MKIIFKQETLDKYKDIFERYNEAKRKSDESLKRFTKKSKKNEEVAQKKEEEQKKAVEEKQKTDLAKKTKKNWLSKLFAGLVFSLGTFGFIYLFKNKNRFNIK